MSAPARLLRASTLPAQGQALRGIAVAPLATGDSIGGAHGFLFDRKSGNPTLSQRSVFAVVDDDESVRGAVTVS